MSFPARLLLALFAGTVLAAVPACRSADPQLPPRATRIPPRTEVVLPTEWLEDYALVATTIEGRGPYRFLLDTGASATVVGDHVARALPGMLDSGAIQVRGAHGDLTPADALLHVRTLALGPCEFRDLHVLVLDLSSVSAMLGRTLDGILGYPLFADCTLTIDYPGAEVRLSAEPLAAVDGAEILELLDTRVPRVVLGFEDVDRVFLLDSGSGGAIDLQGAPDLAFAARPVSANQSGSISGLLALKPVGRLAGSVRLGRHLLDQPIVSLENDSQRFGTQVLRHFRVSLDARGRRARVTRPCPAPVLFPPVRGTGAFFTAADDGWSVLSVLPGTPAAAAGLRAGDRVLAINDTVLLPESFVSLSDLTAHRHVELTVARGSRNQRFRLPIVELVP